MAQRRSPRSPVETKLVEDRAAIERGSGRKAARSEQLVFWGRCTGATDELAIAR
jgi:hypothetical protein